MASRPATVNAIHDRAPSEQLEFFPTVPPRLVCLDGAPVLFSAFTHAEYAPAGFLANLPRTERTE